MNYKTMVNSAYNKYIRDWCEARGYSPAHVDPETGINGECYVCINEFERNEFQNEEYMSNILTDNEFIMWQARKELKDMFLKSLMLSLNKPSSDLNFRAQKKNLKKHKNTLLN
mgnify:CR=1 FL=1